MLWTRFWKWMKLPTVAAATLGVAVSMTLQRLNAAEGAKLPEPPAAPAAEPVKEEALEFRRLMVKAPLQIDILKAGHYVCRTVGDARVSLRLTSPPGPEGSIPVADNFLRDNQVDLGKEMILAAFKGRCATVCGLEVQKVSVAGGEVRVALKFTLGRNEALSSPYDLVACPRRDLPVVYFENGKEVARVPFKAGEDEEKESTRAGIKWSPEREQSVRFALAPGWGQEKGDFRCPWCQGKAFNEALGKCQACEKRTSSGNFHLCPECARLRGECQMCPRKVGPATRGVSLELDVVGPDIGQTKHEQTQQEIEDVKAKRIRLQLGETPKLYVDVKLAVGVKAVPEIACASGKDLFGSTSLFFWVAGPGGSEGPVFAPAKAERGSPMILPLAVSKNQETPPDLFPKSTLAQSGTYTVRAIAGRLISNPVTLVVSEKKAENK